MIIMLRNQSECVKPVKIISISGITSFVFVVAYSNHIKLRYLVRGVAVLEKDFSS